jgi:phosphohistidine phosphatase
MNRLLILRHGIAVPHGSPDFADDDRPLTPKGEKRMRQIGYGLKRCGLKLDRIVSSPLPRAYRTAEIVARVLGCPDQLETAEELRASESAASIAAWIASRTEDELMIVGHNPALSDLVGHLVAGSETPSLCELRRGGIASLAPRADDPAKWIIEWIARPRLIRRMGDR